MSESKQDDIKKVVQTFELWWIVAYGIIGFAAGFVDCLTIENSSNKYVFSSSSGLDGCHKAIFESWQVMLIVPLFLALIDGGAYAWGVHHANDEDTKKRLCHIRIGLELLGVLFYGISLIVTLTYFYNGVGSGSCSTGLRQSLPQGLTSAHVANVVGFSLAHTLMVVAASMMFINAIRLAAANLNVTFAKAHTTNLLGM